MKLVYRSQDRITCGFLARTLEEQGVRLLVRNEYLGGGAGELPINECWPEIWVLDDAQAARAGRLIEQALEPARGAPWTCARCAESVEGQFGVCWRCGAPRPAR